MREGYAVTVTKWGEPILTIERECLSGAELSDEDERAVFEAGQHLCAFSGDPDADVGFDPTADLIWPLEPSESKEQSE